MVYAGLADVGTQPQQHTAPASPAAQSGYRARVAQATPRATAALPGARMDPLNPIDPGHFVHVRMLKGEAYWQAHAAAAGLHAAAMATLCVAAILDRRVRVQQVLAIVALLIQAWLIGYRYAVLD
jgi:hypothetical protein